MKDEKGQTAEKFLGLLLAAASAVLCAAIDYLLKRED